MTNFQLCSNGGQTVPQIPWLGPPLLKFNGSVPTVSASAEKSWVHLCYSQINGHSPAVLNRHAVELYQGSLGPQCREIQVH